MAAMHPDSKASAVLRVLANGPALTSEIAAELGWSVRNACAHAKNLHARGKVEREQFMKPAGSPGPRRVCLWKLPARAS